MKYFLTLSILCSVLYMPAFAAVKEVQDTNYFASLRSNETNVRAGPGQHYPVKFTFKAKSVPVRVISEYDNWCEIEDYEKQTGWVSQNLLTKKRTLLVQTAKPHVDMYAKNNEKSRIIYHLENHVTGDYLKCIENWCAIKVNDKKGWIKRSDVFGHEDVTPVASSSAASSATSTSSATN